MCVDFRIRNKRVLLFISREKDVTFCLNFVLNFKLYTDQIIKIWLEVVAHIVLKLMVIMKKGCKSE